LRSFCDFFALELYDGSVLTVDWREAGMTQEQKYYHSFLLRLWRAGNDGEPVWRASLEIPLSGERLGFANLGEMFAYLEVQIQEINLPPPSENPRDEQGR
jgi:hypothetical protein